MDRQGDKFGFFTILFLLPFFFISLALGGNVHVWNIYLRLRIHDVSLPAFRQHFVRRDISTCIFVRFRFYHRDSRTICFCVKILFHFVILVWFYVSFVAFIKGLVFVAFCPDAAWQQWTLDPTETGCARYFQYLHHSARWILIHISPRLGFLSTLPRH